MTLSRKNLTGSELIIFAIFLTASFDIVGAVDIGGMTFRFSQIFIAFACVLLVSKGVLVRLPEGTVFLLIWLLFQLMACFTCSDYLYSFGYFFWTLLNVAIIVAINGFVKTQEQTDRLMRMYIYSFAAISILGIIQFALGFFGISFFLTQPTLNGSRIPRVNGFTYEPSYYATYLLPGWVITMYLAEKGSSILPGKKMNIIALIVTLALFMSTSRMGWLFMALWVAFRGIISLVKMTAGVIRRNNLLYIEGLAIGILLVIILAVRAISSGDTGFLVDGLGIGGTSDHSSSPRIDAMWDTLELLQFHPLIGHSLGGLPVKFSEYYKIRIDTGATMCVWAELLAASGILGTAAFGSWIAVVIRGLTGRRVVNTPRGNECRALAYGFLFECMILAMNQNILRIYVWTLIGMMTVAASNYKISR